MREVLLLSHELRTPLSVIRGYLDMLDDEAFTEEQRQEFRAVMKGAAEELGRTIELLIDRERRVALAYGLEIPELIEPVLRRDSPATTSGRLK